MNWLLDCPLVIWNNKSNYFLHQFLTHIHIANCLLKQCKECWDAALIFQFKYYFAWFWENNGIVRNGSYAVRFQNFEQQMVLLWPYFYPFNPAYLVIKLFFIDFGQARFFKKDLKRNKNAAKLQNCFSTSNSSFYSEIFFQSMEKV